jgi:antibiotic biosynthesis monooxygenase (ABM) superfamily enzyme
VVTLIIHHQVQAGAEMAYEAWLRELILAAQGVRGHLGVDILRPQADTRRYTMVARFVIFPLTILVPWALQPLFQVVPLIGLPVVSHFISDTVIVGLITYVIMPHYTRWVADWLYRRANESSRSGGPGPSA